MRNETLHRQIKKDLNSKCAFGFSKHEAKRENNLSFGESDYHIYSYQTHATYLRECLKYADWLVTHKGISKRAGIDDTAQYAVEYLKNELNEGKSIYTVKMRRSALGMLYGQQIQIELPVRDNANIKRSRNAVDADSHFAINGKYKDLFTIALSTGGRR